jgi:hypothetical protein
LLRGIKAAYVLTFLHKNNRKKGSFNEILKKYKYYAFVRAFKNVFTSGHFNLNLSVIHLLPAV